MSAALVLVAAITASCGGDDADPADGDVVTETVSDSSTGELSVWRPDGGGPWPVVFLLHGLDGSREDVGVLGARLAAAGHFVVAPTWVLGPDLSSRLECGFRYAHVVAAERNGDADGPVTIVGHSAGASIAIGGTVFDVELPPGQDCFDDVDPPALAIAVAPCGFEEDLGPAGNREAPIVIVSGGNDTVCPPSDQAATAARLTDAGYQVREVLLDDADHWTPVFRALDDGKVVSTPDSDDGEELVGIIADEIALRS